MPSFEFPNLSRWVLTLVKLSYLETKKMNPSKMLDFQRIHFSRKRPWKCAISLLNQICENKSFEPDHQISSKCLIRRFLTVITNFSGALSQKKRKNKKMTFREIINQDLKIFLVSGAEEALILKTKGISE